MSDESEPKIVTPPQYVRLGAVLIALETSKSLREATRAIHDLKIESFPSENAKLRAEVERLTRDRDLAERKAAVCREDAEINARRAEAAEARVKELEAACAREARLSEFWREKTRERVAGMEIRGAVAAVVVEMRSTGGGGASCKNVYGWADRLDSALLSPKPAPLPDLAFDADDPLPDMTPANIPEPKFDIGGTVKFKLGCRTCGGSGRAIGGVVRNDAGCDEIECHDCRGEEKK